VTAFELANGGRIYPGVRIAGVDVGRARTADALSRLAGTQRLLAGSPLIVSAGGRQWTVSGASLGVHYDLATQVRHAYLLGRSGPLFERLRTQATLMVRTENLAPLVRYDRARLAGVVATLGRQIDRPAVDAAVALRHGVVSLWRPSSPGRRLDRGAAMARLTAAVLHPVGRSSASRAVILPVTVLAPRVTTDAALRSAARATLALAMAARLRTGRVAAARRA
jgi:hypothetical protein